MFWTNRAIKYLFLYLLLVPGDVAAQKTLIFVIDVSGSMRYDNLYQRVTGSLVDFIRREFKEGDNIVLCSFGNDFYINKELNEVKNLWSSNILQEIERLAFNDQWTYMTLAFARVAEIAERYRLRSPSNPIYIYLFTDGKNEPPPKVKNPLSFKQILEWYFSSYQAENTYLYVVTLGTQPQDSLTMFVESTGGEIVSVPREIKMKNLSSEIPSAQTPPPKKGEQDVARQKSRVESHSQKRDGRYWLILVIGGGILLLALVFVIVKYKFRLAEFPPDAQLLWLDDVGHTIDRFNLRQHQKVGKNKLLISGDIDIPGIAIGELELSVHRDGNVFLNVKQPDKSVKIMGEVGGEIKAGERYLLTSNIEFEYNSVKLKYEKGD
ncbi:MAG: vWA domain-containing protein [candidate division WOR-3 bacterium]